MLQSFILLQNFGGHQYVSILSVIQVFTVSDCFPCLGFQHLCSPTSPTWVLISPRFLPDCNINRSPSCTSMPLFVTLGTMLIPILGPMACSPSLSCNISDSSSTAFPSQDLSSLTSWASMGHLRMRGRGHGQCSCCSVSWSPFSSSNTSRFTPCCFGQMAPRGVLGLP